MENYTIQTWLLLFFLYSFLGWIWECCYVSFMEKKLVNRGFLYSPMLPIYGSGAVIILVSTIAVRENMFLVFIFGAVGATLLEVATGYLMEVLFKTRYWDYSDKKIHYKGYICLSSTIVWGFFSIIMVKYINVPVENFIFELSETFKEAVVLILLVVFTVDVTKSVQNALDLRELLETMAKNNEHVNNLLNEIEEMSESLGENKDELLEHLRSIRDEVVTREHKIVDRISSTRENLDLREKLSNALNKVTDTISDLEQKAYDFEESKKETLFEEIKGLKAKIENSKDSVKSIEFKRFKGAIGQLKRNSSAKSEKLKVELDELKKM